MRKRLIFLSFLNVSLLFADLQDPYVHAATEGDPTENICNSVNLLTGDFIAFSEDLVIEGIEPIRLKRSYVSGDGRGKYSGWEFFPHLILQFYKHEKEKHFHIKAAEPNGSVLSYKKVDISNQWPTYMIDFEKHGKGITNISHGVISGRTNLRNQVIYKISEKEFKLCTAEGGIRWYKKNNKLYSSFLLVEEQLPNQNRIIYGYDDSEQLVSIQTMNAQKTKTYAWCKITYSKLKGKNLDFSIETSDGQSLQYFTKKIKAKEIDENGNTVDHESFKTLKQMRSSQRAPEDHEYYNSRGIGSTGPLLKLRKCPGGREIKAEYYNKDNDNIDKVQKLFLPLDKNGNLVTAFHFSYDMAKEKIKHKKYEYRKNGKTDVLDVYGHRTKVHYTPQFLPFKTEFCEKDTLHHSVEAQWGSCGQLLKKSYLNASGQEIVAKAYNYDSKGNLLTEQFIGDLTGSGQQEVYQKRFSYEGSNLLIHQEEENGLIVDYSYLPSTDLLTSKLISDGKEILLREFFEYDEDYLLIRKIIDDGKDHDRNNLRGVTERKIEQITRRQEQPAIGYPDTIEEKALDLTTGQERLLKKTVLAYSPKNWVIRKDIYDANNIFCFSLHIQYDSMGRPIEETDALGQITKRAFDVHGNKVFEEHPSGKKSHFSYDAMNRLIQEVNENKLGEKRITAHEYDLRNRLAKTVDPFGNPVSYEYDAFDHCTHIVYPPKEQEDGKTHSVEERFGYDIMGRQTEIVNPKGAKTQKRYNAYGEPVEIQYPDGSKETFVYYPNGKLKRHTDQEALTLLYTYDVLDRIIKKTFLDAAGNILAEEAFVYNGFHLIEEKNKDGVVTHYTYDFAGRKIKEEKAGLITECSYDARSRMHVQKNGELLSYFEYDALDRVIEERQESISGELFSKALHQYDAQNHKTHTTRFVHNEAATNVATFDAFGRLLKEVDPLGSTTIHHYNEAFLNTLGQRVLQQISFDPLGRKTVQIFDVFGKLSILEKRDLRDQLLFHEHYFYDPNQNLICQQTSVYEEGHFLYLLNTHLEYDLLDRKIAVYEADGQKITRFSYTPSGKLHQTIKPDGVILSNTYDGLGYPLSLHSSDGSIHYTYVHNREGQLLAAYDQLQKKQTVRELDAHGRVLKETLMNGLVLLNQYDDLGRRTHFTLPDASIISYTYDALHLRKVSYDTYEHIYFYDSSGLVCEEALPKQMDKLVYSHDLKGRIINVKSRFFNENVTFDPCGNILARVIDQEQRSFAYDPLDQLTQEEGKFSHQFSSDSLNNRRSKDHQPYELNALNQLLATDASRYIYDLNGNPIEEQTAKSSHHFVYDALDRLVEVVQDKEFKLAFTYDNFHRRLSKTHYIWFLGGWSEKETELYFYDDQNEIGATNKHQEVQELRVLGYAPFAERRAAVFMRIQGHDFVPIHDLQGNVAKLLFKGTIFESYAYSAFGEETHQKPPFSPWRFSSKRVDFETGLIFFGRRYYNPTTGRFITPDPEGFTDSLNLYAYVRNNPLSNFDLYGLSTEEMERIYAKDMERIERSEPRSVNPLLEQAFELSHTPFTERLAIRTILDEEDGYFWDCSYQTGGLEHKDKNIFYVNGILNTPSDSISSADHISNLLGGVNVRGVYNSSNHVYDLPRAVTKIYSNMASAAVRILESDIHDRIRHGVNEFLIYGSSEGCIVIRDMLRRQTEEVRNRISVVAIAPAAYIESNLCKDRMHYVSRDFIPFLDIPGLMHNRWSITFLKPHPDAPFLDHGIKSPTFRRYIRDPGEKFLSTGKIR